jgi:hypothetical protein
MKLNDVLTREQAEAGLTLYDDEDFVYLYYKSKVLAVWSTREISQALIRVKAQELLDRWINLNVVTECEKIEAHDDSQLHENFQK